MVVGGAGVVVGVSGGIDTEMPAETDGDFDDDLEFRNTANETSRTTISESTPANFNWRRTNRFRRCRCCSSTSAMKRQPWAMHAACTGFLL